MFINHKKKFVWCRIPKVASQSFQKWYIESLPKHILNKGNAPFVKWIRHNHPSLYCSYGVVPIGYFKWVFVRNPWRRLVSGFISRFVNHDLTIPHLYNGHLVACHARALKNHSRINDITFADFVNVLNRTPSQGYNIHWKPQHMLMGNVEFDFVGKLENMVSDFGRLQKIIGTNIPLQMTNVSSYHHTPQGNISNVPAREVQDLSYNWKDFYNPGLIDMVRNIYMEDIDRFEYTFE